VISDRALGVLRATALFSGFSEEQLQEVPKVALPREFAEGETILHEGESEARSLWLILEGEVEVRVGGEALRRLGPGSHFGEMALLTEGPRSADVVAVSDTMALQLSRDHLRGLIHANPDAGLAMLAELSRRLRRATQALEGILRASPEAAAWAKGQGIAASEAAVEHGLEAIEWGMLFEGG
jgi:CRP-like cAMP-binding protein